jgi:hypothetical protein
MRTRNGRVIRVFLAILSLVVLLAGCEAIFTYTPLASLQRAPSSLSAEQRLEYAQNALASGDKIAMAAALLAIQNDPGAPAQYAAAQLGIEVSGVPQLLLDAVDGKISINSGDPSSITTFLAANPGVQPDFLIAAAARLDAADPATLQPMDFVYGALGLALDAAKQTNGTYDFSKINLLDRPTKAKADAATNFVSEALVALSPTDPLRVYLSALGSYVP